MCDSSIAGMVLAGKFSEPVSKLSSPFDVTHDLVPNQITKEENKTNQTKKVGPQYRLEF